MADIITAPQHKMICENLNFAAKEAFKRLRTNVIMSLEDAENKCRVVGVTSAQPTEGKSTVALNLAFSIAELGKKVLLIDADMRRSSLHVKTELNREPGLSDLLTTTNSIATVIQKYVNTKEGDTTSFDMISGGVDVSNPSELLDSKRMSNLLQALAAAYDYIIIDLPPVGAVIDAVPVSQRTDGMIVVLRENNCPRNVLEDCVSQLRLAKVNILGFVVNGAVEGAGKKYQYNKYY